MTELQNEYAKQYKQEKWQDLFDEIEKYRTSDGHYRKTFPEETRKILKFILKEKDKLKITNIEVYWWQHKPFLGKPYKMIDYILIRWESCKVVKLDCFNVKTFCQFDLTEEVRTSIRNHGGSLHHSEDDQ